MLCHVVCREQVGVSACRVRIVHVREVARGRGRDAAVEGVDVTPQIRAPPWIHVWIELAARALHVAVGRQAGIKVMAVVQTISAGIRMIRATDVSQRLA